MCEMKTTPDEEVENEDNDCDAADEVPNCVEKEVGFFYASGSTEEYLESL